MGSLPTAAVVDLRSDFAKAGRVNAKAVLAGGVNAKAVLAVLAAVAAAAAPLSSCEPLEGRLMTVA